MHRVPLAQFEPALENRLEELWGAPPNLYRALANHPSIVAAWTQFANTLRHGSRTPRALRELVILRREAMRHFDHHDYVELAVTAGFYAMVARVLDAMAVQLEAGTRDYSPQLA
jgi:alkylhydroperoxidase family enzyme